MLTRRDLLSAGLALLAAPAIVRASNRMPIRMWRPEPIMEPSALDLLEPIVEGELEQGVLLAEKLMAEGRIPEALGFESMMPEIKPTRRAVLIGAAAMAMVPVPSRASPPRSNAVRENPATWTEPQSIADWWDPLDDGELERGYQFAKKRAASLSQEALDEKRRLAELWASNEPNREVAEFAWE